MQNKLISYVVNNYQKEVDYVIATIDPNNIKSVINFKEEGFVSYKEGLKLYGNKNRDIYIKEMNHIS